MLEAEFCDAVAAMAAADFSDLEALGARREIVSGLFSAFPPVGKLKIQAFNDGSWQPHESGAPAYVTLVIENNNILDLIAWRPNSTTFTHTGFANLINPDAIATARWADEPIYLHSNPLGWLRADCVGAVPVRFDAGLALTLGSVSVVCDSAVLARKLSDACRIPQPKISYKKTLKEAA